MVLNRCPFCEHGNPPEAVFCSHCGGQLDLAPCPKCGAVNKVTAESCYQCKAPLRSGGTATPPPEPPPAKSRKTVERLAGLAAVVLIVTIAWFASRGTSLPPAPATSAGGTAATGAGPIGTGVPAASSPSAPEAKPANGVKPANGTKAANGEPRGPRTAAKASTEPARAEPATAAAAVTDAAPAEPPETAPTPVRRLRAEPLKPAAPDTGPCTPAKAALGLCPLKDGASPAPGAPGPQAAKPAGQESPRPEACTEAVAALGLCAPETRTGRP